MNFLLYAVVRKRTAEVKGQGFVFTSKPRTKTSNPKEEAKAQKAWLEELGYDPKYYRIAFAHFHGLRKLFKGFWNSWRDRI